MATVFEPICAGERTGRSAAFTARLERRLGRTLARRKPANDRPGEGHTDRN
jgi:hypothetical protein